MLSVNYAYKGKFSQADTWESFSQKWLSQMQSTSELRRDGELCGSALMFIDQFPLRSSSRRGFSSKPSSLLHSLAALEECRVWSEDTRKAWLLQATPRVKHMGANGTRRVETESFRVTIHCDWYSNPFVVCMLLPFPFGTGRRQAVPCGDWGGTSGTEWDRGQKINATSDILWGGPFIRKLRKVQLASY